MFGKSDETFFQVFGIASQPLKYYLEKCKGKFTKFDENYDTFSQLFNGGDFLNSGFMNY